MAPASSQPGQTSHRAARRRARAPQIRRNHVTPAFRSLIKKVLGTAPEAGDSVSPPPPLPARSPAGNDDDRRDAAPHADDGDDGVDEDGRPRRRRGRRGGRNRRKSPEGEMSQPAAPTAPVVRAVTALASRPIAIARRRPAGTPAPAIAPSETRSYGWGRRVDGDEARDGADRGRRGSSRVVRPRDQQHEPPLPEDVAFRSPPEGGDRTIFPGRRRRPQGIREDERFLLAGPRSLSGWIEHNIPLQPYEAYLPRPYAVAVALGVHDPFALVAPSGVAVDPDLVPAVDLEVIAQEIKAITETAVTPVGSETAPVGEDEAAPKRSRRGRRGGRTRRRSSDGAVVDEISDTTDAIVDEGMDEAVDPDEAATGVSELDSIETLPPAMIGVSVHAVVRRTAGPVVIPAAERILATRERVTANDEQPRVERRRSTRSQAPEVAPIRVAAAATEAPVAAIASEVEQVRPAAQRTRPQAVTVDPSTYPQAFVALGATERTLPALASFGFQTPTPIQEQAIPALLNGNDVVGIAKTGSGKTVAFGVPMVEKIDADLGEVQGIVLVPTRELAQQVLDVLQSIAVSRGMQAIGLLGGHAIRNDLQALERRPQIVVGTPGRIIDHLQRGTLSLRHVSFAVLDEADQMLDIGFLPDIRRILSRTPKRRQTALFSATMPGSIRRLIWQFMSDPQQVAVDAESTPVDSVEQIYFEVAHRDKAAGLRELIERELKGRTLVFCKTKRAVDMLEANLSRMGVRVGALHGDMDQRHRDHVVADFRTGTLDVLVATNVAARGLDIPEITHVLNFDVPQNAEEYIHRIGRTGRAGREGKAITFVSEWDMAEFDTIRAEFGERLHEERLDLYRPRVAPRPASSEDGAPPLPSK
ncbi:MAG: DEAD/DEAH box helicase [Dehalococcoidia bacterium]|nr:DEAD/DEAH box helicase [Dehalococcoidia bacterium]